jgi:hypothetical protein
MGKLYHPGLPPNDDGNKSWTEPDRYSQEGMTPLLPQATTSTSQQQLASLHAATLRAGPSDNERIAGVDCITGEHGGSYCETPEGTPGPDDKLMQVAVESVGILANFTKTTGRPFFLGVGFHKVCYMILFILLFPPPACTRVRA